MTHKEIERKPHMPSDRRTVGEDEPRLSIFTRLFRRLAGIKPAVFVFLLFGCGIGLSLQTTPLWWLGGAMAVSSAAVGFRIFRKRLRELTGGLHRQVQFGSWQITYFNLLLEIIYIFIILLIATTMMSDVVLGDRPISHDHTVHYFKAWQMHEHFLPEGRLIGWSHAWFAGYPSGYLYPIGTDLWINAVFLLGLGFLNFSQAYAIAFWLFHCLSGYAGYRFGRMVGGPHVGFVTAVLMLTDLSQFRFGGWAYTVAYGVWPQSLSLAFALLAICRLPCLVEQRRLVDISIFGVWMGMALITHPIHLLFLPLLVIICAIASSFSVGVRPVVAVLRVMIASSLALLIASVWLLPFLDTKTYIFTMGVWWETTYEFGKSLFKLNAFPGTLGYVLAFGIMSVAVLLKTRRFVLLLVALMAVSIPLACSSTLIDELHLPFLFNSFYRVQLIRMSTMVKPFWFALAAYFFILVLYSMRKSSPLTLLDSIKCNSHSNESLLRTFLWVFVLSIILLPTVVPGVWSFWTRHVNKTLVVESVRPMREDRIQMLSWIKQNLPRDGFYRIGVFTGHDHELLDLATKLDKPLYKRGFTPCSNFIYKMRTKETEVLKAVNLRYVLAKKKLDSERFDLLKSFGKLNIYRFKHWYPEPYQIVEGEGKVKVERFSDEEIILTVAEGSYGLLRLNVSYFPRWHAYRDGRPIPISVTSLEAEPETTGFMTVQLKKGRYRFVFKRSMIDEMGLPLSILGVLLACLLAFADRWESTLHWIVWPIDKVTQWGIKLSNPDYYRLHMVVLGVLGVCFLAAFIALALWKPKIRIEELETPPIRRVRFDFLEDLLRADVGLGYDDVYRRCQRQRDRFVCTDHAGNLDIENYVASSPATIKEYKMVRCIRARPVKDALLSVIYRDIPRGDALIGYYGVEYEGRLMKQRRPVQFSIMVDGITYYQENTIKDTKMHWFNLSIGRSKHRQYANIAFSVKASNIRRRHFCFYAQMVDF